VAKRLTRGCVDLHGRLAALSTLGLAIALLVAASASASVESEIAFHRGVVAYGDGRLEEARAAFEQAIAGDPEDPAAFRYLGLVAQAQNRNEDAVAMFQRAVTLDPENPEVRLDLATALLAAGRPAEASAELERVVGEQPENARAHLLLGIAAYQERRYQDSLAPLARSAQLDPGLKLQARYYTGLANAFLGDLSSSSGAFADAASLEPGNALSRSAAELRDDLERQQPRDWSIEATLGGEFDSNPRIVSDDDSEDREEVFRGIARLGGWYRLISTESASLRAGYDGYVARNSDENDVDQHTHVAWLSGTWFSGPFRFGARYDFADTFMDYNHEFRRMQRISPNVGIETGDWGLAQLYYQGLIHTFPNEDFDDSGADPGAGEGRLERDGYQNLVGLNQFVFPGPPIQFLRFGGYVTRYDSTGDEWTYQGFELSAAGGLLLPYEIDLTSSMQFAMRHYLHRQSVFSSSFSDDDPSAERFGPDRDDQIYRLTVEASKPIWGNLSASVAYTFTAANSDINDFEYKRHIGGVYAHYTF
jgi:tetratricopeptide (TPR) repeat protein